MSKMEEWNEILDSKQPVVFQCSTSWCRPCQVLKPLMEKATAKHDGAVKFYYIDVEKFPQVGEMLQVSSVPHVFAVRGGEITDEFTGVVSDKQIDDFLEKAKTGRE
jgi:thioredoxin-like negative regulator of GroEL